MAMAEPNTAMPKIADGAVESALPINPTASVHASAQVQREPVGGPSESLAHSGRDIPTRESSSMVSDQKSLPNSPFPPAQVATPPDSNKTTLDRMGSLRSTHSGNSGDVDMGDDDDEEAGGSDNESVASTTTSTRPSAKKKKGQKFYCTEFPPCQLSFTRSEHLARHIRKHTGERPFQCHCSRRFSRLDNLRQHAQTVHVNEEIPGDSLAATGTRFQRQIRTDRVRPTNRPRTSSLTQGSPSRGHSRNVSTSSIASTSSGIGSPEDYRRRPMPLAMAGSPSPGLGLTLDTRLQSPTSPGSQYHQFYSQSSAGLSTPTSAFTPTASSPRSSGLQSPISIVPRALTWAGGMPRRRLSVPSATLSYQFQPSYPAPYMSPVTSSNASTFSNAGSALGSPTSSTFSDRGVEHMTEAERRRRTWHPSTVSGLGGRPATSGLSYYRTPDSPGPIASTQPAATQAVRLPGIDSFDRVNASYAAPARRPPSPMQLDEPNRPLSSTGPHKRRPSETQWDAVNQNLTRLEIANATPSHHSASWRQSVESPLQTPTMYSSASQPGTNSPSGYTPVAASHSQAMDYQHSQAEEPTTPRKKKRQGWYAGPPSASQDTQSSIAPHRTSPEDSSSSDGVPTPSTASTGDYQPAIVHSNGYIETTPLGSSVEDSRKTYVHPVPQIPSYQIRPVTPPQNPHTGSHPQTPRSALNMDRLDALAAVATSANHGSLSHQS